MACLSGQQQHVTPAVQYKDDDLLLLGGINAGGIVSTA
jgi:hypothetical protein